MIDLKNIPTLDLVREIATRLQNEFKEKYKNEFEFGFFKWIIHRGKLQAIESHPRWRNYFASHGNIVHA